VPLDDGSSSGERIELPDMDIRTGVFQR